MMIGIVGGTGPYAGLDLLRKVLDNTVAGNDQEHLDTLLFSLPSGIPDRTAYLLGKTGVNPGVVIAEVLIRLEAAGATVAGIPCNTAHAEKIFGVILDRLQASASRIRLLHMIDETIVYLAKTYPGLSSIGVLSTTGTYRSGVYAKALGNMGYQVVLPAPELQERLIHPAIYDPEYGIKSCPDPVHPRARENLLSGIAYLEKHGAEAVILGCTEIPMAVSAEEAGNLMVIDPTRVLARALIRSIDPSKLKPEN